MCVLLLGSYHFLTLKLTFISYTSYIYMPSIPLNDISTELFEENE